MEKTKMTYKLTLILFLGSVILITGLYGFHGLKQNRATPAVNTIAGQLLKTPLQFEKNVGQTDTSVSYLARGVGYGIFFTPQEIVVGFKKSSEESSSTALKIKFAGADPNPILKGVDALQSKSNYFIGNEPEKWCTNIPHYAKISYEKLYPGIDVVFYGTPSQLEYDICVAPGANPQDAQLQIQGAKELFVDDGGNLHILTEDEQDLQMQKPFVYQLVEGSKCSIEAKFTLLSQNVVGFSVDEYDLSRPLIIDPVLNYSTYLGGAGRDESWDIKVDSAGNAYVTGSTTSVNFPVENAYQSSNAGSFDVFVTKFSPTGSSLVYSTYLGGSGYDETYGIAVDSAGNAYVTGYTDSPSGTFPLLGAYQATYTGYAAAFVTKLSPTGSLVYSTYLGGDGDYGNGIAVDSSGNAYVTGVAYNNLIPAINAYQSSLQGDWDAFVTKFSPTGASLVYSTYLGGSGGSAEGLTITVDSAGGAYVVGYTNSSNFPVKNAYQGSRAGVRDAFVTKFTPAGSDLDYSTYLGGSGADSGLAIIVDSVGNAYVTGETSSTNFPVTPGAFQESLGTASAAAFVTKFNPTGSVLYSTYLGGSTNVTTGSDVAVDSAGYAYVVGGTNSNDFPTTSDAYQSLFLGTSYAAFVSRFNPDGTALVYSTFLEGNNTDRGRAIAVNSADNAYAYVTGITTSTDFPTQGAYQSTYGGGTSDVFVTKFTFDLPTPPTPVLLPPHSLKGHQDRNISPMQVEYYNVILWSAPASGTAPVSYKIYRDAALRDLVATVPASGPLKYKDRNRNKRKSYSYFIVSVDVSGNVSQPISIIIPSS